MADSERVHFLFEHYVQDVLGHTFNVSGH